MKQYKKENSSTVNLKQRRSQSANSVVDLKDSSQGRNLACGILQS